MVYVVLKSYFKNYGPIFRCCKFLTYPISWWIFRDYWWSIIFTIAIRFVTMSRLCDALLPLWDFLIIPNHCTTIWSNHIVVQFFKAGQHISWSNFDVTQYFTMSCSTSWHFMRLHYHSVIVQWSLIASWYISIHTLLIDLSLTVLGAYRYLNVVAQEDESHLHGSPTPMWVNSYPIIMFFILLI